MASVGTGGPCRRERGNRVDRVNAEKTVATKRPFQGRGERLYSAYSRT